MSIPPPLPVSRPHISPYWHISISKICIRSASLTLRHKACFQSLFRENPTPQCARLLWPACLFSPLSQAPTSFAYCTRIFYQNDSFTLTIPNMQYPYIFDLTIIDTHTIFSTGAKIHTTLSLPQRNNKSTVTDAQPHSRSSNQATEFPPWDCNTVSFIHEV
jgi:hypothetical protein